MPNLLLLFAYDEHKHIRKENYEIHRRTIVFRKEKIRERTE